MEILLHNTDKIIEFNGLPARIWEGTTASGIQVHAYITRIALAEGEETGEFERELQECRKPTAEIEALPLRMIL